MIRIKNTRAQLCFDSKNELIADYMRLLLAVREYLSDSLLFNVTVSVLNTERSEYRRDGRTITVDLDVGDLLDEKHD